MGARSKALGAKRCLTIAVARAKRQRERTKKKQP
jgi:hypothetical protein